MDTCAAYDLLPHLLVFYLSMPPQRDYVGSITEETLKVAEPLKPAAEDSILHILEDDDTENPAESG